MRKYYILSYLILLFTAVVSKGQPYYFSHYQVENGLSNNAVLCIMQDHLGFMWFGTRDGLNRFDGISYKVFRNSPGDKHSIGSNAIMSLTEDNEKHIWIGTERGLFIFDENTEKFVQFKQAGNVSILSVKAIGDEVYYIALYTLYCYNRKSKTLKQFLINKEVTAYTVTRDSKLWICTSSGTVLKFNKNENRFDDAFDVFKKSRKPVSKWLQSIFEIRQGVFLIGTSNQGLKLLDTKSSIYKDILDLNKDKTDIIVRDILEVTAGNYWVATESGIYILHLSTGRSSKLERNYNDPFSLSDNIVHALFKDRQGGIWAGTYFGGVNYLPKQEIIFKKYFHQTNSNSISGNAISVIRQDPYGILWVGTEDAGLNRFNENTNQFTSFNPSTSKQSVSYSNIHSLLISGDTIWVGTYLHGLDLITRNGKRLYNFNTENSSIGNNLIYTILKTKKGEIYIGTGQGIFRYSKSLNNFHLVSALPKVFFKSLEEDARGNIWAGTYGDGVYVFNPGNNFLKHYLLAADKKQRIAGNIINYIYCAGKSTAWIATEGGLYSINSNTDQIRSLTSDDGLPSDIICAILEDNKNNLWLSTSRGLTKFNPLSREIKIYNKSYGLLTDQFNYRSAYKDAKGNMYFGSVKGMVSFNPNSIFPSSFNPPIYITGFQVNNKELPIATENSPLRQSITLARTISLPYNQSSFSIDFAALDYSSPSSISYAYKLTGLDKDWTYLPTNRKVYFTELPPGDYSFSVKSLEPDKGGNLTTLAIRILPPYWRTWWAYLSYVFLSAVVIFLTIRFFIERSKIKNRYQLEKLAREKDKENYEDKINFYMNVAHEIKTPLTLINGPMENIMDKIDEFPGIKNSISLMSRNSDRLMQLANQLLDFRKLEMKRFELNVNYINVSELAYDIYARFKSIADQKNLKVFDFSSRETIWANADEEALTKIFSNLTDNAIKYSDHTVQIALFYSTDKTHYNAVFTNDGFIIPEETRDDIFKSFYRLKETSNQAGTGIGLALSRSLAEIHGGELKMEQSQDNINTFVLTMPVSPEFKKNPK
jgi:ligand-binding sensor domain-containing protein/signal transduction histidine kinase